MKGKGSPNNTILVIADIHTPFHLDGMFDFLSEVKREYKPDSIIINGDLLDSYFFSAYPKDVDSLTASTELAKSRDALKKIHKIFPKVKIADSNHDARLWRKGKVAGIPRGLIIPYNTLIGIPEEDWQIEPYVTLRVRADSSDWVFYHHLSGNIKNAAMGLGSNLVLSHTHTKQGTQRVSGLRNSYWACDTGCFIDEKKYAFAYQKLSSSKPVTGCLLIEEGQPLVLPYEP